MAALIRTYHPLDLPYLYDVCLKTANSGKDASALLEEPWLPAQFFLAPYLQFEPELTQVLVVDKKPVGYITGTSDSAAFQIFMEQQWLPELQSRTAKPPESAVGIQAILQRIVHTGYHFKPEYKAFPAHLHIDILPEGQGGGNGKELIETFISKLKLKGVRGLHLEVGKRNETAIGFYEHVGFKQIADFPFSIGFGMEF
ncbi:GNAT family N-acetyltransferase [bacterium]|nr:MAG: GNAT family N-acetyltransferase [bacterium]